MPSIRNLWADRRLLVLVLVLLALAGLAISSLAQRGPDPSAPATDQAALGTVILVPGYGGGTDALEQLSATLRAAGRQTAVLRLAGDGTGDLRGEAQRLAQAVDAELAAGSPSVDVIGYSAGGVVTRLWATELGGAAHARRIVLLGSPNHGTELAGLGTFIGGGVCPEACRQLAPDSALLSSLNAGDLTPPGPLWVTMWTDQDQVVTPPDSARLDGAVQVVAQDVCPGAQIDHGQLPTAPLMQGLVLRALAVPLMTEPSPADCQTLVSAAGP